jgi:hypothetical protein
MRPPGRKDRLLVTVVPGLYQHMFRLSGPRPPCEQFTTGLASGGQTSPPGPALRMIAQFDTVSQSGSAAYLHLVTITASRLPVPANLMPKVRPPVTGLTFSAIENLTWTALMGSPYSRSTVCYRCRNMRQSDRATPGSLTQHYLRNSDSGTRSQTSGSTLPWRSCQASLKRP